MPTNENLEIKEEKEINVNSSTADNDGGGFKSLQVDQCEEKAALVPRDVCPDERCDESAPVIDPWDPTSPMEESYFDPQTCEYVFIVVRDKKDLGFDPGNPDATPYSATLKPQAAGFWKEQFTTQKIVETKEEKKMYTGIQEYCEDNIKDAIKMGLSAFNKRVSDATVCAFGGCVGSFDEMEKNRDLILHYQNVMRSYDDSISDRVTSASWITALTVGGIVAGPAGMVVGAGIALGVSLIGEAIENLIQDSATDQINDYKIFQDQMKSILGIHNYNQLRRLESIYGKINPYALEWVAYVPKENGWTIDDSGALKFQVRVPAYNFNILPVDDQADEDESEDEVGDAEITLTNMDWRSEYTSLYAGLVLYRYEQDYRLLVDNSTINFKDDPTGHKLFFFDDVKVELKNFKEALEEFLNSNDMRWGYQINPLHAFKDEVEEIVITLGDEGEGENVKKLYIKKIEIKTPNCPLSELKERGTPGKKIRIVSGLESFKAKVYNSTLLYLLSKKDTALMAMQAEEPSGIIDFCDDFIFPAVYCNYGMDTIKQEESNTTLGCIADKFAEIVDWRELIEDLVLGTVDALKDQLQKEMCKDKTKTKDPAITRQKDKKRLEKIRQHMIRKKIKELKEERRKEYNRLLKKGEYKGLNKEDLSGFANRKARKEAVEEYLKMDAHQIKSDAIDAVESSKEWQNIRDNEHPYMGDIKDIAFKKFDYEDSLLKLFADIFKRDDGTEDTDEKFRLFTGQIGWCGMVVALRKVLNCLFGQISFEDAVKIIFKKATGALSLNQFYYLFVGLPMEKQLQITDYVRKQLSAVGNIGAGVNLEQYTKPKNVKKRDSQQKEQAKARVSSLQSSFNTKKYNRLMSNLSTKKDKKGAFIPKSIEQYAEDVEKATKMMEKFEKQLERAATLRPNQGSIGKATANMVGVVLEAYLRAFEELLSLEDLLNWLKKIPGVSFGTWLWRNFFSCPSKPLVNPPLKDIIKFPKFKIDFCDPTRGFLNFKIPKFNLFNPWELIKVAFFAIIKRIIKQILIKLLLKLLKLLEELLCKLLEGLGKGALNAVTGNSDGQPFLEAFRGVFCGPDATDDDVRKTLEGAMGTSGLVPQGQEAAAAGEIPRAIAGNFSTKEIMLAISDPRNNTDILDRVQKAIVRYSPTFGPLFSNPNAAQNLFNSLNNMLPNDEAQAIRDALAQDYPDDIPLLDTICLNKDELDEWNRLRKEALTDQGLNDQDAQTLIDNYNNRTLATV